MTRKSVFQHMKKDKIYCGIDIGAHKIKAAILKAKDIRTMELIGVYENSILGFKEGAVCDLGELSESIHKSISGITKRTGLKLKEVQLGIGGDLVAIRETNTMIPLMDKGNKVIAHRDIKKVNHQARLLGIKMEEEIIHDLPQFYQVDENDLASNPLGLYGRKLGVHSLMIISSISRLKNITNAVHQAGFEVSNIFFSSLVSSDVVCTENDKNQGCVLVDIGSRVMSILVFQDGTLRHLKNIHMGGENFTRKIAEQLNLPFELAEEIKESYASALSSEKQHEEEILVKKDDKYIPIKREILYQAIQTEITNIVESIKEFLNQHNVIKEMKSGMIVLGGGALLPGLIERIERETQLSVRLGKINLQLNKSHIKAALYAPVLGIAYNGIKSASGILSANNGSADWRKNFFNVVKEIYQDYF